MAARRNDPDDRAEPKKEGSPFLILGLFLALFITAMVLVAVFLG